jgi:hypothetical protein
MTGEWNPNYRYQWLEHQAKVERHGLLEDQRQMDVSKDYSHLLDCDCLLVCLIF